MGLVPINTRAAAPAQAGQAPQSVLRIVADRSSAQPASARVRIDPSNKSTPAGSTPSKAKEPVHREKADDSSQSDSAVQSVSYDRQLPDHQAEPAEGASWAAARLAAGLSAPSGLEPVLSRPATIPSGNRQTRPVQVEPPATEPSRPVPPVTEPSAVARPLSELSAAAPFTAHPTAAVDSPPAGRHDPGLDVDGDEAVILGWPWDECNSGVFQAGPCGDPGRFWIRAAYLAWWKKGIRLPALVTTSPADTPFSQAGVLGEPNTRILFGDSSYDGGLESGYRMNLGYWLDPCRRWGLEGDFFEVGQGSVRFHAQSAATGDPILGRPFFDVNPATGRPREAAELVSFPGLWRGSIDVEATDYFQSAGMWLRYNLCSFEGCCQQECGSAGGPTARWYDFWLNCGCDGELAARWCDFWSSRGCRLDLIAGYRYYRLDDSLAIREHIQGIAGGPLEGTILDVRDSFRSRNEFHGGEIGLSAEKNYGRWSLQLLTKVAIGNSHQVLSIGGATQISQPGADLNYPAGVYALDSNIGTHTRNDFVMIPQIGVGIDYQLTCRLRVFLGYDILYWANVARAPEQIDRFIDSARIPQSGREGRELLPFPGAEINYGSFWAQGINTGLDFRF